MMIVVIYKVPRKIQFYSLQEFIEVRFTLPDKMLSFFCGKKQEPV